MHQFTTFFDIITHSQAVVYKNTFEAALPLNTWQYQKNVSKLLLFHFLHPLRRVILLFLGRCLCGFGTLQLVGHPGRLCGWKQMRVITDGPLVHLIYNYCSKSVLIHPRSFVGSLLSPSLAPDVDFFSPFIQDGLAGSTFWGSGGIQGEMKAVRDPPLEASSSLFFGGGLLPLFFSPVIQEGPLLPSEGC